MSDPIELRGLGRRSWSVLFSGVCMLGLSIYIIVLAVRPGAYDVGRWTLGPMAVLMLVLGVLAMIRVWFGRRPLQVTGDTLVLVGRIGRVRIPLSEISGVGLVFSWVTGRGGRAAGWYLAVWDGAGKQHLIEESWVDAGWTAHEYATNAPPTQTSAELAATPAGQLARRLYDRVWGVQGSAGPLATRQAQKMRDTTVWTRDMNTFGYWSPDGDIGTFGPTSIAWDDD